MDGQESPSFNTELVWEVEKRDLRKIRTANQPLRLECLTCDQMNRKERVGFSLLSLRSAKIIPLKDVKSPVPFYWQKLIGCQFDKKSCHPELYISLTIRDHLLPSGTEVETNDYMPYISEEENDSADELVDRSVPVQYLDDGYIQIGEDHVAMQPYTFNMFVAKAINLDTLLPEVLVFRSNRERYYMSFKIFGITIKTKPFFHELHEDIFLNEKIVVRLLSSLDILKKFFEIQPITINFFYGRDKLGLTTIDLKSLLPPDLTNNFPDDMIKMQNEYYFKFPSVNGIVPKDDKQRSPFIDIETSLRESNEKRPITGRGEGDQKMGFAEKVPKTFSPTGKGQYVATAKSVQSLPKESNVTVTPKSSQQLSTSDTLDMYKKFSLEATVKSIVWKKDVGTRFIFKFIHPTAQTFITVFIEIDNTTNEEIGLTNLLVKMPYISTDRHIQTLIQAWRPKFCILNEEEDPITEEYSFNTELNNSDYVSSTLNLESATGTEIIAEVTISAALLEFDIEDIGDSDLVMNPPVLDEIIFIKELGDLQKWKLQERERFEQALEELEVKEMKSKQEEFEAKKVQMQSQLNIQMNKCRKLQDELTRKLERLKTDKALHNKRNRSHIYESILKDNMKKYSGCESQIIIEQLSKMERDNHHLKELIEENKAKLDEVEKSTLTKEQTQNLLQELKGLEQKFAEAQDAKKYFKEQWKKACDEIHELRTDDMKHIQENIVHNKKALSQLSLDGYSSTSLGSHRDINTSRSYM